MTAVAAQVPVVPDADEARRWIERELADPVYHQQPSILRRVLDWLAELFDGASGVALGDVGTLLVVVGALAVVVVVTFLVTGPVRRSRRLARAGAVLGDD
ncbi:hypothetical protein HF998_16730, partial [Cellulomonas hominis]|nr:hypothetical protein [Cellulomonas hominis]